MTEEKRPREPSHEEDAGTGAGNGAADSSRSRVASPSPARPLFSRRATALLLSLVAAFLAVGAGSVAFAMAWVRSPYVTMQYADVRQPMPFSHQIHAGALKVDCRFCHNSVERAPHAGIPPTRTCVGCHSDVWMQSNIFEPVRTSLATGKPIPWRRVTTMPDFVFFNHSVHVQRGVECTTCHGDVAQMPRVYQARPLTMQWCLSCHRDPARYLSASTAHLVPSENGRAWPVRPGTPDSVASAVARLTTCSACHR